jgi:hypothetical protein
MYAGRRPVLAPDSSPRDGPARAPRGVCDAPCCESRGDDRPIRRTIRQLGRKALTARVVALGICAAALAPATVAHADDADGDTAGIVAALVAYNAHAAVALPVPPAADLASLVDGRVIEVRTRTRIENAAGEETDRIRVVGYRIVDRPRLLVWLAALNIGTQHAERLTEHVMQFDDSGGSVWYQYLNLPWPLKNRHWVIRNEKRTGLTAATNGVVWEHAWRLEERGRAAAQALLESGEVDGLDARDGRKALYLPVNRGGWTMFELDEDRTLVAIHVMTVMGGWIPDRLVANMASEQLEDMLTKLAPRADVIHERYDTSYPIFTGDARRITLDMARAARGTDAGRASQQ